MKSKLYLKVLSKIFKWFNPKIQKISKNNLNWLPHYQMIIENMEVNIHQEMEFNMLINNKAYHNKTFKKMLRLKIKKNWLRNEIR